MIKSMTGFGRCELADEKRKITVEIKSVNHRYLDANIKMPRKLSFFESSIRTLLKEYAERGKIDIFITYEDYSEGTMAVKYNKELAAEYFKHLSSIEQEFEVRNDISIMSLSRMPEVFTLEELFEIVKTNEKKLFAIEERFGKLYISFLLNKSDSAD